MFNILVVDHRFDDVRIQAAACRSGDARLIAISPAIAFEPARRAILGHELAHHLADLAEDDVIADRDVHDDRYSTQRSPEEQRASAFSIMLLVPRKALSLSLGSKKLGRQEARPVISSCRTAYGVGFEAMTWHLFHLGYLDFSEDVAEELAHEDDGLDASGFHARACPALVVTLSRGAGVTAARRGRARWRRTESGANCDVALVDPDLAPSRIPDDGGPTRRSSSRSLPRPARARRSRHLCSDPR
jgi:Zn-dependent peptidase ImmA (M78 family)